MNMIMHGDGHVGVYQHDGLFNVGGVYDGRFDVVLINPPFGARLDNTVRITGDDVPSDDEVRHFKNLYGDEYMEKVYPTRRELEYTYVQKASLGYDLKMIIYTVICILYSLCGKECTWILNELIEDANKTKNQ